MYVAKDVIDSNSNFSSLFYSPSAVVPAPSTFQVSVPHYSRHSGKWYFACRIVPTQPKHSQSNSSPAEPYTIWRRWEDFIDLSNELFRLYPFGSVTSDNGSSTHVLPKLSRKRNLFQTRSSVAQRREELDIFVQQLVSIPHSEFNDSLSLVLNFFGIWDGGLDGHVSATNFNTSSNSNFNSHNGNSATSNPPSRPGTPSSSFSSSFAAASVRRRSRSYSHFQHQSAKLVQSDEPFASPHFDDAHMAAFPFPEDAPLRAKQYALLEKQKQQDQEQQDPDQQQQQQQQQHEHQNSQPQRSRSTSTSSVNNIKNNSRVAASLLMRKPSPPLPPTPDSPQKVDPHKPADDSNNSNSNFDPDVKKTSDSNPNNASLQPNNPTASPPPTLGSLPDFNASMFSLDSGKNLKLSMISTNTMSPTTSPVNSPESPTPSDGSVGDPTNINNSNPINDHNPNIDAPSVPATVKVITTSTMAMQSLGKLANTAAPISTPPASAASHIIGSSPYLERGPSPSSSLSVASDDSSATIRPRSNTVKGTSSTTSTFAPTNLIPTVTTAASSLSSSSSSPSSTTISSSSTSNDPSSSTSNTPPPPSTPPQNTKTATINEPSPRRRAMTQFRSLQDIRHTIEPPRTFTPFGMPTIPSEVLSDDNDHNLSNKPCSNSEETLSQPVQDRTSVSSSFSNSSSSNNNHNTSSNRNSVNNNINNNNNNTATTSTSTPTPPRPPLTASSSSPSIASQQQQKQSMQLTQSPTSYAPASSLPQSVSSNTPILSPSLSTSSSAGSPLSLSQRNDYDFFRSRESVGSDGTSLSSHYNYMFSSTSSNNSIAPNNNNNNLNNSHASQQQQKNSKTNSVGSMASGSNSIAFGNGTTSPGYDDNTSTRYYIGPDGQLMQKNTVPEPPFFPLPPIMTQQQKDKEREKEREKERADKHSSTTSSSAHGHISSSTSSTRPSTPSPTQSSSSCNNQPPLPNDLSSLPPALETINLEDLPSSPSERPTNTYRFTTTSSTTSSSSRRGSQPSVSSQPLIKLKIITPITGDIVAVPVEKSSSFDQVKARVEAKVEASGVPTEQEKSWSLHLVTKSVPDAEPEQVLCDDTLWRQTMASGTQKVTMKIINDI